MPLPFIRRVVAVIGTFALVSVPSAAQSFTTGDLYLYTTTATSISTSGGGLRHIVPSTGVNTLTVDFDRTSQGPGGAVYDPYRKRILFSAALQGGDFQLWQTDATGATEPLGFDDIQLRMMCETGDGRVYMRAVGTTTSPFRWIDQASRQHVLLDSTGTQPFIFPGLNNSFPWRTMSYDAGTNALFITGNGIQGPCGGATSVFTIFKIPLSADGSRVTGPATCAEFAVDPTGTEVTRDAGRLPSGELLFFVSTNAGPQVQPRLLQVDPVTLAIAPYASWGDGGVLSGGTYSSALGKAVLLDSLNDDLFALGLGESGTGSPLGTNPTASLGGSIGETTTLFEIAPDACPGAFVAFGSGLAGTGGETPALYGTGCSAPGENIALNLRDVVGGANGFLLLSLTEGAAPFKGGELYTLPLLITIPIPVGGPLGVAGAGDLDLPLALPNDAAISGAKLIFQGAFVDGAAPVGVSLTQGLRIEIG